MSPRFVAFLLVDCQSAAVPRHPPSFAESRLLRTLLEKQVRVLVADRIRDAVIGANFELAARELAWLRRVDWPGLSADLLASRVHGWSHAVVPYAPAHA